MKSNPTDTFELVKKCCRALDDKKAGELRVLDVREQSSITDYLVVATGTSEPHLRAMRVEIEKVLDAANAHIMGMDAQQHSGWMVIDAFDLMVHLFLEDSRKNYRLENLWRDAPEISVKSMLAAAVIPRKAAVKRKPAAVKKKVATPGTKKVSPKKKPAVTKKTKTG